ncbi:hypothetical protein ACHAW6_008812 [Cyclotella cf. meneghiniana]
MLEHGLSCKRGVLVSIHHDDLHDECAHLCGIALTNLVIKPIIFYGNGLQAGAPNANPANPTTTSTQPTPLPMVFGTKDKASSIKILLHHTKVKKEKYKAAYLDFPHVFTPLVYSIDSMPSNDARTAEC